MRNFLVEADHCQCKIKAGCYMYMFMEYIFVILVVRLIKMTIDLDYCNIFFNVNNKKLRWILCIGVYLAAVLADIIFDSEFIKLLDLKI